MAFIDNLKQAARAVADTLGVYARSRGWKDDECRIAFRADRRKGQLYFIFASKHFDPEEELRNYVSVREYLGKRLADEPELLDAVGIVIETFEQLEEGGLYAIGPEYRAITPRNLARVALREVAQLITRYADNRGWPDFSYTVLYRFDDDHAACDIRVRVDPGLSSIDDVRRELPVWIDRNLPNTPGLIGSFRLEVGPIDEELLSGDARTGNAGFKDFFGFRKIR